MAAQLFIMYWPHFKSRTSAIKVATIAFVFWTNNIWRVGRLFSVESCVLAPYYLRLYGRPLICGTRPSWFFCPSFAASEVDPRISSLAKNPTECSLNSQGSPTPLPSLDVRYVTKLPRKYLDAPPSPLPGKPHDPRSPLLIVERLQPNSYVYIKFTSTFCTHLSIHLVVVVFVFLQPRDL